MCIGFSLVSCISLKQYPLESYSWVAPEVRQFEALDQTQEYPDNAILFIGSSSIRLWNTLEEDMKPFPVIKRGYGGAHFRDIIFYTDRILADHQSRNYRLLCCQRHQRGSRRRKPKEGFTFNQVLYKTSSRKTSINTPSLY